MKRGTKHLIPCHCILPQYRNKNPPIFHKFVVFSVIDSFGSIESKIVQCNNCNVLHKVIDICRSEILLGKDESIAILSIDDLRRQIPDSFASILEENKCDLPTWENLKFILDEEMWGENLVLSRENLGDSTHFKIMNILSKNDFKIEVHLRKDEIEGEYSTV